MKPNQTFCMSPQLKLFSDDQLETIHLNTLEVLERIGVNVDDADALSLLADGGAFVDGKRVRIPSWMVEKALRSAPPRVVLGGRDGKRRLFLENNNPYFGLGSDMPYTIDTYSGERRDSRKDDVVNAAIVAQNLENIDFVMSMAIAKDTSAATSDLHQFEAMVSHTEKPIVFTAHHKQGLKDIHQMAVTVLGSEDLFRRNPFIACYSEPISPLRHCPEGTEKLLCCAELGIPIIYTPGLMSGATGPVTLAGAVVTANAELLSGIVIHQLKKEGAPFIYGGVATIMDMRSTIFSYGAPDFHLNNMVLAQMAKKYRLPVFSTGGCSDSPVLDQQAALEAAYSLVLTAFSGANLIHDVGYLEAGLTQSLASMVICNEMIAIVRRLIKGYELNQETIALDVIEEVGPGGEFLTHSHTAKYFKTEHWSPNLIVRDRYDIWKEKGGLDMGERANKKVKEIIEQQKEATLEPKLRAELNNLIAAREIEYQKSKTKAK